jgi:hypothetical protein
VPNKTDRRGPAATDVENALAIAEGCSQPADQGRQRWVVHTFGPKAENLAAQRLTSFAAWLIICYFTSKLCAATGRVNLSGLGQEWETPQTNVWLD